MHILEVEVPTFFFVMDSVLNKASLTFDKSIARKIESCSYSYFYPIVIVCCISGKKKWMLIFRELFLDIKEVKYV